VIYLDCTTLLSQNFVSGIQRIIIDFGTQNDNITPIIWSKSDKNFYSLKRFPNRQIVHKNKLELVLVYWLLIPLFKILRKLLIKHKNRLFKNQIIRRFTKFLYSRLFAREKFENWRPLVSFCKVDFFDSDYLCILDIPTQADYLDYLRKNLGTFPSKKIIYVHDLIPIDFPQFWSKKEHKAIINLYKKYLDVITKADKIICNSNYTKGRVARFFKNHQVANSNKLTRDIKVIYPSSSLLETKESTRYFISKDTIHSRRKLRILLVGNPDKRKNFIPALQAINQVSCDGMIIEVIIVSPISTNWSREFNRLLNQIKPNKNLSVQFHSDLSDAEMASMYQSVDILLVPSLAEGFGLPVIEGLYFGCEVIVAGNTALKELAILFNLIQVKNNSVSGWKKSLDLYLSNHDFSTKKRFDLSDFKLHIFKERLLDEIALEKR
jgi:glycosyltransferase involved in cell wall biosynthesis